MVQDSAVKTAVAKNRTWGRKLVTCSRGLVLWLRQGKYIVIPSLVTIGTTWAAGARWNLLMPIVVLNVVLVVAEIFNTSIEKICNLIDGKWNGKIKEIKDISSSSVLVIGLVLLGLWLWVLIDAVLRW